MEILFRFTPVLIHYGHIVVHIALTIHGTR